MIREYGDKDTSIVLLQMVDDHDLEGLDTEIEEIKRSIGKEFCLATIKVRDWNKDLSPWNAPAVFGKEDFGDGAKDTLKEVIGYCSDKGKRYIIGGYSLAALFALWAVYQTDVFKAAACASPSIWFPGFSEYMKNNSIRCEHVYLSLGDKEEKTRNPVMATVGNRIKEAYELLEQQGIDTELEWNSGNHFKDADKRTAKAFAWAIGQICK